MLGHWVNVATGQRDIECGLHGRARTGGKRDDGVHIGNTGALEIQPEYAAVRIDLNLGLTTGSYALDARNGLNLTAKIKRHR